MVEEKEKTKKENKTSHMQEVKNGLKPGEIVSLRYDEAFCMMFGNPDHLSILTMLLSKILQVNYEDLEGKITLLPRKIPNDTVGEKKTEMDVAVRIATDEAGKVLLEVNIKSGFYESIITRNIHYMEELAISGLDQNADYKDIPATILVNFNNFYVNGVEKIFDEYMYRNSEGKILTTKRRILNINIAKCHELWYNDAISKECLDSYQYDLLLLSALLFTNKEKEFKECLDKVKISENIKSEIMEVLLRMKEDSKLVRKYLDYEVEEEKTRKGIEKEILEKGISQGILQGISQGAEQKQREMVISFYNQGVSLDIISKASNLTIPEVEEIIKNSKTK